MNTPWGRSQQQNTLATGIVFYSTARHGGYHLSQQRFFEMPESLRKARDPQWTTGTDSSWFEEDLDWCLVCLAFPEYFSADLCRTAIRSARAWSDKTADHYPGWVPWDLDVDQYLATTFKGRQCAAKAGIKLERQDGVSPSSSHWFESDIVSDALYYGGGGVLAGSIPQSAGAGEQRATGISMRQADLFCNESATC